MNDKNHHEDRHDLDRWLDDAAAAESREPVDADRFLHRLRTRIEGDRILSMPRTPLSISRIAAAILLPLGLAAGLFFFSDSDAPLPAEEVALIEDLDLLVLLDELSPEELSEIDPELFDLYEHLEMIEELPVDVLGDSES